VIVPAFNQAAALGRTLPPLVGAGYTVVVVDDGSTDRTWAVLGRWPVARLRHAARLGKKAAIATGMAYAWRQGAAGVVTFEAGRHDAAQIPRLLEPILDGEADVVRLSRAPRGIIALSRRALDRVRPGDPRAAGRPLWGPALRHRKISSHAENAFMNRIQAGLIYLALLAQGIAVLLLFSGFRALARKLTAVVRELALFTAEDRDTRPKEKEAA
jgi:glycosyltransferase involved in cell wall biosynthesis